MKKVLHYKTNYLNKSETFINRLVRNHKTYSPSVLCYNRKSFTEGLDYYEVPKSGIVWFSNFMAFHANATLPFYKKIVKKVKPDLIHAHFGYDGAKLMKLAYENNIPLLVSFYGADVSRLPTEFGWKKRYKKLAALGTHFVAASNFMKNQLIDLGFPEHKINVVRFGIKKQQLDPKNKFLNPSRMIMVGRMVEKKGFEHAIHAVSNLNKKGIRAELNLYGDGPLMNNLLQLVDELQAHEYIFFHGYQPIENILKAHKKNSLLLAPSVTAKDGDMEGLPNTILEAMAMKTLVVATRHAAIPEVIEHQRTGFLVDEHDISALTITLEEIINGKYDLETILNNAKRVVEKEYSLEKMVTDIEQIYNKISSKPLADESEPYRNQTGINITNKKHHKQTDGILTA